MALTSALYTGLSGLDVNQTRMNVIGNNIANVNTIAFKASRALFKPQFYVTDAGGSAPTDTFGGTNPSQRGLGAEVATIEKDFTGGAIDSTGKDTDMAIQGNGFFVISDNGSQVYTRDGSFTLNSDNNLVTSDGKLVQGYGVDSTNQIVPGKLQNLNIPIGAASTAEATQNMSLAGNLDSDGAVATGASILNSQDLTEVGGAVAPTAGTLLTNLADAGSPGTPLFSAGQTFTLEAKRGSRDTPPATFTVSATSTVGDLMNFFNGGLGIDTTVPTTATEPTPGTVLEAGAAPNTARFTIAGDPGAQNSLEMGASSFVNGATSPFTFQDGSNAAGLVSDPTGESVHTSAVIYDSLGTPVSVDVTAVYENQSSAGTNWRFYVDSGDNKSATGGQVVGNGTLTFDSNGKLLASTGTTINIDRSGTGARTPFSVKLDFSGMTALASQSSDLVMNKQDGSPLGSLTSFSVGGDGTITGSFSNGLTRTLGQVALATFNNNEGLDDRGGGIYSASANSGASIISAPLSLGAGQIVSGALEQSNVDLSKEFVNLIVASTGFSASSRVISTSNQMLTELLNTNR